MYHSHLQRINHGLRPPFPVQCRLQITSRLRLLTLQISRHTFSTVIPVSILLYFRSVSKESNQIDKEREGERETKKNQNPKNSLIIPLFKL